MKWSTFYITIYVTSLSLGEQTSLTSLPGELECIQSAPSDAVDPPPCWFLVSKEEALLPSGGEGRGEKLEGKGEKKLAVVQR